MSDRNDVVATAKMVLQGEDYVVLRSKSYEHTLRELDRARNRLAFEQESAEHARRWAKQAFAEERRLADRLDRVIAAAASLGVSIQAINEALGVRPAPGDPVTPE